MEEEFEFQCETCGEEFYILGWVVEVAGELHFRRGDDGNESPKCPNDQTTDPSWREHDVSVTGAWA